MIERPSLSDAGEGPRGAVTQLTAVILARDEEAVLAPTLESARQVADQLVLVDTGSQDRTRVIGYRYGAKVVQSPWEEDFAAARNRALEELGASWILWLDAGERVDPAAGTDLKEFVRTQADPAKVYEVKVVLPPADPAGSATEVLQARLMPNRPGLRFRGRIRETLQPAMETLGMQWAEAPGIILCHPRRHHPDWKRQRAIRNLRIAHQENAGSARPEVRLLLAMADRLVDLADLPHARALYLQAVQQAQSGSVEQLEAYYGLLTTSDTGGQAGETLLAYALQAVEVFPLDAQLLCLLGQLLGVQGRWPLAARAFQQAFQHGQICGQVWHLADLRTLAGWGWSLALDRQNQPQQALAALEEAAAQTGADWIRYRLMEKYISLGRLEEALQEITRLRPHAAEEEICRLHNLVRAAILAAQKDYPTALPILEDAYQAGCREPLCLHWLVAARLAAGQPDSAEPVLREWQRVDPAHPELRRYREIVQRAASLPTEQ